MVFNKPARMQSRPWVLRYWWVLGLIAVTALWFVITGPMSFVTVNAGEVGVQFDPFNGGVQQDVFHEGVHMKPFWVSVDTFSTKTQAFTHTVEKVSRTDQGPINTAAKDNLFVDVDITVLTRIDSNKAPEIRRTVGRDGVYQTTIVDSQIRSKVRDIVAKYDASQVYSTETRGTVESDIKRAITDALLPRGIIVEDTLLRGIYPPTSIRSSIESKKQAEQDAQRMEYVLQKEKLEAERVVIQARGITEAQDIIQQTLTPAYLHYLWLQKLSEHNNVIYVPTEGNFPMFKDMDSTGAPTKVKQAPPVVPSPGK